MNRGRWIVLGVVLCLGLLLLSRPRTDDTALATQIVGRWRAVDTTNNALHKQKNAVLSEEILVQPDGKLIYKTVMTASPDKPKTEPWGWAVKKGRLLLQFRGEGAIPDDWMPPVKFRVSADSLSILRKGFAPKEFSRVNS